MSLIRWQPQSGWACLSIRIVRLVSSGRRLPGLTPRGCSISPAGPAARTAASRHRACAARRSPARRSRGPAGRSAARCPASSSFCVARGSARQSDGLASVPWFRRGDGAWAVPLPKPDPRRTARGPPLPKIGTLRRALRRLPHRLSHGRFGRHVRRFTDFAPATTASTSAAATSSDGAGLGMSLARSSGSAGGVVTPASMADVELAAGGGRGVGSGAAGPPPAAAPRGKTHFRYAPVSLPPRLSPDPFSRSSTSQYS